MREILFRGKQPNGEWAYGCINIMQNGNAYIFRYSEQIAVDPSTVGQFTGLTDKNGKKIFEGDCFREDDMTGVVVFEEATYKIKWYGIRGALMPYGYDEDAGGYGIVDTDKFDLWHIENMEVIGNIYDNPELLEESK